HARRSPPRRPAAADPGRLHGDAGPEGPAVNGAGTALSLRRTTRTCLGLADPPPSMTCTLGRDHRVGTASRCPACLRLTAACAVRPCSATQPGRARREAL